MRVKQVLFVVGWCQHQWSADPWAELEPTLPSVCMGKRTKNSNLSGLFHFAKQAFHQSPAPDSSSNVAESSSSQHYAVTITAQANFPTNNGKSPRTELLTSQWGAYDATGLVPHYKTASEVPEHLQKCTGVPSVGQVWSHRPAHRLLSAETLFQPLRRRMLVRRGRVVQCHSGADRNPDCGKMPVRYDPRRFLWRWRKRHRVCQNMQAWYARTRFCFVHT